MVLSKGAIGRVLACMALCTVPMLLGSGCVRDVAERSATEVPAVPVVASAPAVSLSGNITIDAPFANATVPLTFSLQGQARVFESTLQWRVKDSSNVVIDSGVVTAAAPDVGQFGPYSAVITLPSPGMYTLESYSSSAEDGSEINLVSIVVQGV